MIVRDTSQPKSKWKSKLFLGLGIIILIFAGINLAKSTQKNREINQEIYALEKEIQDLEKSNSELNELVKYFNSAAYIEEKARTDLGLKKEGEKVVIVTDIENQDANQKDLIGNDLADKTISNPKRWWRYFFE